MHRNNRGGKNFVKRGNFPRKDREKAETVHAEQLQEIDVGITEYINEAGGFSAILKARYSDFQVNEINLAGEVAVLTDTKVPVEFTNAKNAKGSDELTEATPLEIIPQEIWDQILEMMKSTEDKIIEFEVTPLSKEQRGEIHNIVKRIFKQKIVASTITKEDKKYLEFKKYSKEGKRTDYQWPKGLGQYVHFLLYKENIDTLEAILKVSDCLRIKPAAFTYAGVKDRRAKTTQWLCVRKVEPWKLLHKCRPLRMLRLGNFTFKDEPLKLGQLKGNKFRVALRNVIADDVLINSAMESLRENGFVNYYGLQRFGNDKEVPTYEIGQQLLLGKFKEACDLILKCKASDDPHSDITNAKQVYNNTRNAKAASECFRENTNKCVESKLMTGLAKTSKNEYVNALENIPRNMRLIYIHAFQAMVWNKMTSRRIKEFGLKPIVGDLVVIQSDDEVEDTQVESEVDQEESGSDAELQEDTSDKVEKRKKERVKHLTLGDLGNYSIYDIVLPLPGYDVEYPENTVKDWYRKILEERGLSLEMPKQRVKTYTLSGAYRNILQKTKDLSWKIMHYNDPNDNLIHSDFDQILGREPPQDCPDGKYKALVIEFSLKPSSYATMTVREILKTDTSKSAQEKLNSYHDAVTLAKQEVPLDCAQPKSLLADPEKFAEFKRSIFGSASEEDTPKRKCDEDEKGGNSPAKKTKINEDNSDDVDNTEEKDIDMKLEASLV